MLEAALSPQGPREWQALYQELCGIEREMLNLRLLYPMPGERLYAEYCQRYDRLSKWTKWQPSNVEREVFATAMADLIRDVRLLAKVPPVDLLIKAMWQLADWVGEALEPKRTSTGAVDVAATQAQRNQLKLRVDFHALRLRGWGGSGIVATLPDAFKLEWLSLHKRLGRWSVEGAAFFNSPVRGKAHNVPGGETQARLRQFQDWIKEGAEISNVLRMLPRDDGKQQEPTKPSSVI